MVLAGNRFVSVVDLAGFALSSKIEFPEPIAHLANDPPTGILYALSADPGVLHEFHWPSRTHRRSLSLGGPARELHMDPNGGALWVSLPQGPALARVSLENLAIDTRLGLPASPTSFDVSPYFPHVAASLEGGGLALVPDFHASRGQTAPAVRWERQQEVFGPVRFRSDGRQLIAANHTANALSILRATDAAAVVDLPVGMAVRHLCFKPDGGQLFVTDGQRDGVAIIYPYSTEVDRIALAGTSPGAMFACSRWPYLLVANRLSSDVTILDMITGRLVAVVPVGNGPGYVTATPDEQYALVLNEGSGDMAVIRLANVRSQRSKTAPLFTMVPVGEQPQSLVVVGS